MANSADPDQLASSSGSMLFAKAGYFRVQQDNVCPAGDQEVAGLTLIGSGNILSWKLIMNTNSQMYVLALNQMQSQ